jgi:glycosyltransferase involved in cell wall biosynthesis
MTQPSTRKILFIASHRKDRAPGQRFRFEQYFAYLEAHGYCCELSYFINEQDDKVMYKPGNFFRKLLIVAKAFRIRLNNVFRRNDYAIIFIFREAFMTGSTFFERMFRRSRAKLVFDFDDAIWHLDISEANRRLHWLKNPAKTGKIIGLCDLVFAGNAYLADYARQFNREVVIVPTTIDTEEYRRIPQPATGQVTIGWSGSITTIKHFEYALPFLQEIKARYGDRIRIKVIGDASYRNEALDIRGIGWSKQQELAELSSFDIGIMPLPDDEWAKGKCGLKGLQYMALEIPTIMSPVGVNTEIIRDGHNGFLATTPAEWTEKLIRLIEDAELRKRLGREARQTVIERYSVLSQQEVYRKHFDALTAESGSRK